VGVEPFLVSATVRAFLAQRLVRKLCSACREPVDVEPDRLARLGLSRIEADPFYRAVGCRECRGTGYRGRLAIFEMVRLTSGLVDCIHAQARPDELRAQALRDGFQPMREDGWA